LIEVFLSLGSNVGDRKQNLERALALLAHDLRIDKVSSIYETEPVGVKPQRNFLNLACRSYTTLTPAELLSFVKRIESELGRIPGEPGSPRPIDIDILFYGKQCVNTNTLVIPHPRLPERAFVLVPMAEIDGEWTHPASGKTIKSMLEELTEEQNIRLWNKEKDVPVKS
jgi:2-amino-4-hydroxy-6-hydroxymethyldihydropteridine diphosphokinase